MEMTKSALPAYAGKRASAMLSGGVSVHPALLPDLLHFLLAPQILTIYNSFFENYREGLEQVGPRFVGFQDYVKLFAPDKNGSISILRFAGNTLIMWIEGAIPQILIALLLSVFFTSYRLKIKGQQFFKTVIYMPNLIMASAFFYAVLHPVLQRGSGESAHRGSGLVR